MAININQFSQTVVQGVLALALEPNTITCEIDTTSAGSLVPGQAVKIVDSLYGIPKVVEIAADTDDIFGFINYNIKDATFGVGARCEISMFRGNVMWMTVSAAVARNAKVMAVVSGSKVATATVGKTVIGRALDKASTNGDLIRVIIDLPAPELEFVQAANVAALAGTLTGTVVGTIVNVAGTGGSTPGASSPTAANVDTGIATAIAPLVTSTNLALKELQTTLNAEIAALKAALLQASS